MEIQTEAISPLHIAVPDAALIDLKERLARTRWPEEIANSGWTYGFEGGYLRELRDYWLNEFDWRQQEADWGTMPHFQARVQGLNVHFIHVRGDGPNPMPILITHGWPGSFLEMLKLIPLLAHPQNYGGRREDAFDVIVPSLPGYAFSEQPTTAGWNSFKIAAAWDELMQQLGYKKYVAQGGDFGANVSTVLAWKYPQRVPAFHLNYIPGSYRPFVDPAQAPLNDEEKAFLESDERWMEEKGAYHHVQRIQPQTLAAALNDSPMGLAAWIIDKFRDWADCDGDVERRFTKDELLANVSLYWLTGTIGSSMRLYLESKLAPLHFARGERISTPCGVARFLKEEPFPPRSWAERVYNIQRWTEVPQGGHFASWEEPALLAREIREFFRPFRSALQTG